MLKPSVSSITILIGLRCLISLLQGLWLPYYCLRILCHADHNPLVVLDMALFSRKVWSFSSCWLWSAYSSLSLILFECQEACECLFNRTASTHFHCICHRM